MPPQVVRQHLDALCYVVETQAECVIDRDAGTELRRHVAFPVFEAGGVRADFVATRLDPIGCLQVEKRRLELAHDGAPHIEESGPTRPAQIFPADIYLARCIAWTMSTTAPVRRAT